MNQKAARIKLLHSLHVTQHQFTLSNQE